MNPDNNNRYENITVISSLMEAVKTDNRLVFRNERQKESIYSYKDIWTGALAFAEELRKKELEKGDKVILIFSNCPEFHYCFYGTLLAGGIPVPSAPPAIGMRDLSYYLKRLLEIIDNSGAKLAVSVKAFGNSIEKMLLDKGVHLQLINVDIISLQKVVRMDYNLPLPEDICFIQYTSGSTGSMKGVPLTHNNIITNIEGIGKAVGVKGQQSCLSWMPFYHDMGLIGGMLLPMYFSCNIAVFMSTMLLAHPFYWLQYMTMYKTTIAPANNFAYQLCIRKINEEDIKELDLSNWRIAFNGSEPISIDIIEKFYDKFKSAGFRKESMVPCYGLAEASLGVTFPDISERPRAIECSLKNLYVGSSVEFQADGNAAGSVKLVSLGKPIQDTELKIFDNSFNELPERFIGRICIKGPSVMKGYYHKNGLSRESFFGEWLVTGDIGFLYEGNLYFTGREKELVVIRGKKYSAVDIENIVKTACELEYNCVAFGYMNQEKGNESLGLIVETQYNSPEEYKKLEKSIQKALIYVMEIKADKLVFVPQKSIQKTLNGKIRRLDCANIYREYNGFMSSGC